MIKSDVHATVRQELQSRVAKLRTLSLNELRELPKLEQNNVVIQSHAVCFSTHCELQQDGGLLVLVRSDRRTLASLLESGSTEGFWISPTGEQREATDKDVLDFFA
jgi:hypothetical protein